MKLKITWIIHPGFQFKKFPKYNVKNKKNLRRLRKFLIRLELKWNLWYTKSGIIKRNAIFGKCYHCGAVESVSLGGVAGGWHSYIYFLCYYCNKRI